MISNVREELAAVKWVCRVEVWAERAEREEMAEVREEREERRE